MATSSIFTTVRISNSKRAEAFIDALDAAADSPNKKTKERINSLVTDTEKLKRMMAVRFPEDA